MITLAVLKLRVVGMNFFGNLFYRLLLINGINWTLTLKTVIIMQFFGNIFAFYKTCR